MNEYSILMRLLTRPGSPMGATLDDMVDILGLPADMGRHVVLGLLSSLNQQLRPLGLMIRHNPLEHVFYLDVYGNVENELMSNLLSDRLAATLFVVMTLAYQEGGWVSLDRIREFRRKTLRSLREDVRELVALGYLEFDSTKKNVRPGSRVSFEVDQQSVIRLSGESNE